MLSYPSLLEAVLRVVAQLGRALRSGRRGRRFKSCQPDQKLQVSRSRLTFFLLCWAQSCKTGAHLRSAGHRQRRAGVASRACRRAVLLQIVWSASRGFRDLPRRPNGFVRLWTMLRGRLSLVFGVAAIGRALRRPPANPPPERRFVFAYYGDCKAISRKIRKHASHAGAFAVIYPELSDGVAYTNLGRRPGLAANRFGMRCSDPKPRHPRYGAWKGCAFLQHPFFA